MKRIILAICLLTVSLLLLGQYSVAEIGAGCKGKGGGGCKGNAKQQQQQVMDAETREKYDKFMAETVELRKELEEKALAYRVLMTGEKQDPEKAALVTNEYFQLRDFITQKAVAAGIIQQRSGCNGCGGKQGVACGMPATQEKKI